MIVNTAFLGPCDKIYTVVWSDGDLKIGDLVKVQWIVYRNVLLRISDSSTHKIQTAILADMEHMGQLFKTAREVGERLLALPFAVDKAHGSMLLNNLKNAKEHLLNGNLRNNSSEGGSEFSRRVPNNPNPPQDA